MKRLLAVALALPVLLVDWAAWGDLTLANETAAEPTLLIAFAASLPPLIAVAVVVGHGKVAMSRRMVRPETPPHASGNACRNAA